MSDLATLEQTILGQIAAAGDVKPEAARAALARLLAAEADATGDAPPTHVSPEPSRYTEVPK